MVVTESSCQDTSGFRITDPFGHPLGVAEIGQSFQQTDETFTLAPVALAKDVAQVLAAEFGAVIGSGGFADGEQ